MKVGEIWKKRLKIKDSYFTPVKIINIGYYSVSFLPLNLEEINIKLELLGLPIITFVKPCSWPMDNFYIVYQKDYNEDR